MGPGHWGEGTTPYPDYIKQVVSGGNQAVRERAAGQCGEGQWALGSGRGCRSYPKNMKQMVSKDDLQEGGGALVVGGRGRGLRAMGAGQRGSDCGSAAKSDTCLSTRCSTTTCLSICYSASPPAAQPVPLLLSEQLPVHLLLNHHVPVRLLLRQSTFYLANTCPVPLLPNHHVLLRLPLRQSTCVSFSTCPAPLLLNQLPCSPTAQPTAAGRLPVGEGVHAQVARHPLCKHRGPWAVKLA